MMHSVRFFRCVDDPKLFRAVCSCRWSVQADSLEELHTRAATHDLDKIQEPPLKQEGFVSGLE